MSEYSDVIDNHQVVEIVPLRAQVTEGIVIVVGDDAASAIYGAERRDSRLLASENGKEVKVALSN